MGNFLTVWRWRAGKLVMLSLNKEYLGLLQTGRSQKRSSLEASKKERLRKPLILNLNSRILWKNFTFLPFWAICLLFSHQVASDSLWLIGSSREDSMRSWHLNLFSLIQGIEYTLNKHPSFPSSDNDHHHWLWFISKNHTSTQFRLSLPNLG